MRRILVTISRDWDDYERIWNALNTVVPEGIAAYKEGWAAENVTIVHGASQMDFFIAGLAFSLGMDTEAHPADWKRHGKGAGFIRNQEMVDRRADICLAFIKNNSHGASDCADRAEAAGIPVKRYRA